MTINIGKPHVSEAEWNAAVERMCHNPFIQLEALSEQLGAAQGMLKRMHLYDQRDTPNGTSVGYHLDAAYEDAKRLLVLLGTLLPDQYTAYDKAEMQ